jgi:integrase
LCLGQEEHTSGSAAMERTPPGSKRMREPTTLTVEQFHKVLEFVKEPFRIMCIVAICLGLRASELVGLQWNDFDSENLNVDL